VHLTTSAADFSKETLVVKEEETYDAGAFEKVEAEVVKRLKEPSLLVEPPPGSSISPPGSSQASQLASSI
jgi:hypothetical protein